MKPTVPLLVATLVLFVAVVLRQAQIRWAGACFCPHAERLVTALCVDAGTIPRGPVAELEAAAAGNDDAGDDVLSVTQALMAAGGERAAAGVAEAWLRRRGWAVSTQDVAGGRGNVVAVWGGGGTDGVRVLLSTHLDVVPGGGARERGVKGGFLYGRGSVDARGLAAGIMVAAAGLDVAVRRAVGVLLVCGEETDHAGMTAAAELPFRDDLVLVNGEPTDSAVATFQKGMLKLSVTAVGRACHSGYPHLGSSAIALLLDVLGELRTARWPEGTDWNIGVLEGGEAPNVVPAHAEAKIMFRLVTPPKAVEDVLAAVVARYANVSYAVITRNAPLHYFAPPRSAARFGTTVVAYNTDVPYFNRSISKAVLFGAGSITTAHTNEEYVSVEELRQLPQRYRDLVTELLGVTGEAAAT